MTEAEKLQTSLRSFYNESEAYFAEAGDINTKITPERQHLFSFIPQNALLLDVGCGQCENAAFLGDKVRYVACDLSRLALERARALNRPVYGAVQAESQRLPFKDNVFDAVISTYALEHFVFPEASLREMWRVCRKNGRIILISPAYDHPLQLPPSVGHWPRWRRGSLAALQLIRQTLRHVNETKFYFPLVRAPRVLDGEYQPDFDAVHLVSAREISNFFKALGGRILFERKRNTRPAASWRDRLRNFFLSAGLGEYAGLNLQIAVEKP